MELIQIGKTPEPQTVTVLQMFQQLAEKEAEMIRAAREKLLQPSPSVPKRPRTNS